jgi:NADH-quinone oxidoreductase subunit N
MIALLDITALDAADLRGAAPMLAVTCGILLALAAEIVPALRPARGLAFLGSLVAAIFLEVQLIAAPAGEIFSGAFGATASASLFGLLCATSAIIAWAYSLRYYKLEAPYKGEHDALILCATLGMLIMCGALDLLTFFVGLELLSVPLYALAAFRRARRDSVEAGLRYFLLGAFAAGLFLFGAALLYASSGTLSLAGLRAASLDAPLALMGGALVISSLFFKVSVFPFHLWVPDVYQGSPTPVTTFMATGTKAAGFAFLFQVAFLMPAGAAALTGALAVATMAVGNLAALVQTDLKRLFAFSAVAHAGTLLLGVAALAAGDPVASGPLDAALYYMGAYIFTAGGAFGLVALMESEDERFLKLDALRGLGRRRPGLAAALSLFMLSLGGFPLTGGFLGKYFIFASALRADLLLFSVLGILLSVVALGYYLRVVMTLWMLPAEEGAPLLESKLLSGRLVTWLCTAMVLALGLAPGWFLERFF